jgi:hypothetical protein
MIPLSTSLALVLVSFEAPVDPDRGEAQRWAAEELSKPQYASAKPSWIAGIWNQFLDWLRSLNGESISGANIGVPLIGALAVVLIVVAVIVVRPRLNARKKASGKVFDGGGPALDADEFRARASAAASREDWQTAVVEQFRAVVRAAEDRAVIEVQPGRTADEAAAQLGRAFGEAGPRLEEAARIFDRVKYGKAPATASDHAAILALDTKLSAMKPDFAGQSANGLAVPR